MSIQSFILQRDLLRNFPFQCLGIFFWLILSFGLSGQTTEPTSCDDSGIPAFNIKPCSNGTFIGADINTRDNNLNLLATVSQTDVGGVDEVLVEDGTEYCDLNGLTSGSSEGPDITFNIPVVAAKRESCEAGVLTILLRGDYNNSCEVAYIVNECDVIIAQSQLTGLPEGDKCDIIFPLSVAIPAADLTEAAADGVITFSVRTNGGTPGFQGSEVDGTCGSGRGVDCDGDGILDGNCIAFDHFSWPIQNTADAGTLNSTENIVCSGESLEIDVLPDLMFDDPNGTGTDADSDPTTGSYHLDFYYGGGPNPPNPYPSDGGNPGDLINVYTVSMDGSNPQVEIINTGGTGVQDHTNTNAPLASGGGNLPSNTLIEVVGSVWGDSNVEPVGIGSCFGDIVNCGDNTNYISFVLLDPIEATASCTCLEGNTGVVTISGFDGGLPAAVAAGASASTPDYTLQPTGGVLSSTTTGVGGSVTLTMDPGETNWSVTVVDGEGCEFHLNGSCGIEEEADINFPTYLCLVDEDLEVGVSPSGGTLSGPGVSGTSFNPADAGVGTHTLIYTYEENGCEISTELDVTVESADELDTVIKYDDQVVCPGTEVNFAAADDGGIFTGFGVTDNGDGTATFSSTVTGDYVVTYSLSTASGCSVTTSAIITVDGNKPEIMVPPSDLILECDGAGNVAEIANWVAMFGRMIAVDDNGDVTLSSTAGAADGACPEIVPYTFTAEDECGNSISEVANVYIFDTTPPSVIVPAPAVVTCTGLIDPEAFAETVTASDDCDNVPMTEYALINYQETCSGTTAQTIYTYVFTSVDACGNQSVPATSTYTIEDPLAPTLIAPADLEVECGQDISLLVTEWLDDYGLFYDCFDSTPQSVTSDYDATSLTDECGATIPVTWTVTTACGASATATANIVIADDTDGPIMTCVTAYTFAIDVDNCGANIAIPLPLATDCNGIGSLVQTSPAPNEEFPIGTTTVTFTAEDICGNTSICTTEVTIIDTQNPDLVCPPSINACNDLGTCGWVSDTSVTPVTSDCGSTTLTYSVLNPDGTVIDPTEIEGYIFEVGSSAVTVTSTDEDGNDTTCQFTVMVTDCEAPILECPEDLTVECDAETAERVIESSQKMDDPAVVGCDCVATQGDQTFPISSIETDGDAVSFYSYSNPDAASANTGFELPNSTLLFLHENTITGEISLVIIMDAPGGGGGRASMDFFCLPTGATVDLSDDAGEIVGMFPSLTANFAWADCCTDGTVIGNVGCNTTFDFIPDIQTGITDMAWVTGTVDAPIYTSFDSFTEPIRIKCGDGQPECCQNSNMVTSTDSSCPNLADGTIDVTTDPDSAPYTFLWSTGDTTEDLGAVEQGTYTVTITDVNDCEQIMDVEVGLTQTCTTTEALENWLEASMGSDNCDNPVTTTEILFNTISGCGSTETLIYEFTATDEAGNQTVCYSSYTIEDTTPPTLDTEATDMTVECDGNGNTDALIGWLADNGGAVASDVCSEVTWSNDYTTLLADDCGDTGSIEVIFTATDECGNAIETAATFTIEDTIAPEIVCPESIILECNDPANDAIISAWLATATGTDDCNGVTLTNTYPNVFVADCGETGEFTVTFTATDACDNETTCEATITIEDNLDPKFVIAPQDLIVECDGAGNLGDISNWILINGEGFAEDQCDMILDWTAIPSNTVVDCGEAGNTPYTFTITDECGNTATAVASVIIEDTTPPIIEGPDDTTMACNPANNPGQLTALLGAFFATDVCDTAPVVTTELYNSISGCGGTSAETYLITATDICENTSTRLFTFTIEDTQAPTLEQPDPLTLECGDPDNATLINAWFDEFTGTDFCGGNVSVTNTWDGDLVSGCDVNTIVSFNISDECGNNYDFNSTITIDDTVDPYFVNCPTGPLTINVDVDVCGAYPIFSTPVALDECDVEVDVEQTGGLSPGSEFPVGTTTLEFTATDDCGNTTICTYDLIVVDSDIPTILCPSNAVIACNDEGACEWTSVDIGPTVSIENCDFDITYAITGELVASGVDDASGEVFPLGTSEVCYTITDENDNTSTCCFDVIVEDCEAPEITCPADLTVECDGDGNSADLSAWLAMVSATDNCDLSLIPTNRVFNTISGCGNSESTVYEFIVIDAAGNEERCLATFTIEDTTTPVIDSSTPPNLTVECDGTGNQQDLIAWLASNGNIPDTDVTEGCGTYTWMNDYNSDTESTISSICNGNDNFISYMIQFWVVDECGNVSNMITRRFRISDTTPPAISAPDDLTLECGDAANNAIISAWINDYVASDICDQDLTITTPNVVELDCGMTSVTTYTFTATDNCGNLSSSEATITIEDTTAPEITVEPVDLFVDCGSDVAGALADWLAMNGGAMGQDNCDDAPMWSSEAFAPISGCGTNQSTLYTFTLTDACGNESNSTATFGTTDTTAPELTPPTVLTVECDGAGNLTDLAAWLATASAIDDCELGMVVTNQLFNTISACGGGSTAVYQFTVVDGCGNMSQGIAEFTIEDTTPPAVVCPMPLALECGDPGNDQKIIDWLSLGTGTDSCSGVDVTADYPGVLPADCMGSIDVTFTATDDCGNETNCVSQITMDDMSDPYFVNCPTLPLTINVDVDVCGANPIFSTPVALDDCDGEVDVEQTGGLAPGTEFPVGTTTIEFTATDDCGNTSICTFDIIVVDSDVPNILCPSNTVIACNDMGTCEWESVDIGPSLSIENCPYEIAYDITGELEANGEDDASGEVFPLGLSEVCYTITDENGNTDTCCFDVLVEDCEAPEITCPIPDTVECDGDGSAIYLAEWLETVTAMDNCDEEVTITSTVINTISGCGGTESLVYEFTAVDLAGNTTTCVETFTIEDTIAPEIDAEASDMVVECDGNGNTDALLGWLANNGGAVASDICSDITWTNDYTSMIADECAATGEIEVTFTVTDACGNLSETTATFTIEDTVVPEITAPADIVLECAEGVNDAVIAAWANDFSVFDVCDVDVTVEVTTVVVPDCGSTSVTTYTYTATDACGNVNADTATVTIEDTTAPVIDPLPIDLILECNDADNDLAIVDWLDLNGGALATDACGTVAWTYTEGAEEIGCGNTTTTPYTFIATDECDNVSTAVASVIIEDTTPPELVAPTDLIEDCEDIIIGVADWRAQATSSDLCGTPIITSELWNTISGCGNTFTETYLFTATDECGNSTTAFADYGLEDTTVPVITTEAMPMTVECNGSDNVIQLLNWINNNGGAVAIDGCGDLTWSNDYGLVDAGACDGSGSITVTFTVEDECGNTSETEAVLTIEDTEAPTFEIPASDLTLECRGDMDPLDAINSWLVNVGGADAEDDCSLVTYTNDFVALADGCSEFTGSALVTFTATDACGNSDVTSATVTVLDETPPMITRPATDLTVECDGAGNAALLQPWLDANGDAEASDLCSPFTWNEPILVSTIEGCGETMTLLYEFATTDDCGNISASTIASFIIEDTTSPAILPEAMSMTVECDGMGNEADLAAFLDGQGEAIAADDCGDVVWEFDLVTIEETCALTNIQTYRFTATDACGNTSTSEAVFTIEDTTAPTIVGGADMLMEECDPRGDNYPEFDFWLEDFAGATATDDCSQFTWTNDFNPSNWVFVCGFSRYVDVTFTATDECGNADRITHRFGIGDITPPEFTFCPPPVIVDAPAGWCSSYVNYSGPLAEDACGETTITQVDDTGLTTGDLFPVGLTILTYEAEDECGNVSTCEIKIIVNDFHTPPTISCPIDTMTVTDVGVCGAIINDIAPFDITDNCPDNLVVKYEVIQNGNIIADGFDDASGVFFPTGTSTVTYQAIDQPLILITEIIQDGVISGVEIGNIGPATVDVSCLNVVREGTTPESYNLINGTSIPVGGVITQSFTPIAVGAPAGYYIELVGRVIDGVSINGHSSATYPFVGNIVGEDIYRIYVCDHDVATDFIVAASCFTGSYGTYNPDLAVAPDNGTQVGLQEGVPSIVECSFDVTIEDVEVPSCAMYDTLTYVTPLPQNLDGETCSMIDFIVTDDFNVGTVILADLQIMVADAGSLSAYLTSPTGTSVQLFGGMCTGTADVDVTLDQSAFDNLSTVLCAPLGNGLTYEPLESFKGFFNESSLGTWTLSIEKNSAGIAILENVELQLLEHVPYTQTDVKLDNDADLCGAEYTWDHPVFWDNCCEGGVSVVYSTEDGIVVPVSGDVISGSTAIEFFEVGITSVVYTLVDQYGNESQCSFEIEVCDVEDPVIDACPDLTLILQNDDCTVPISTVPVPNYTDQCPGVTHAFDPLFEEGLPEGVHEICLIVTDASGNEAKCTFMITVLPNPDELTGGPLACIADVNLSLDASCMAVVTADIMLVGEGYGCLDDYCVTLTDQWENVIGTSADGTNIVTEEHIGQQIIVEICESCDEDSGNCCWGYLNVESKLIPDIVCPPDTIIECNMAFAPELTGMPIVMSCEQEIYFSYEDNYIEHTMCDEPVATIERVWTVTDESNNTIECIQMITITDFDLETVVYPDDVILTETYTCTEIADDPTLLHPEHTGYPLLGGIPVYETGDGLCSHFWNWDDQILYNCEGSYEIIRTWLIRDMCDPIIPFVNPIEHYQSIKVLDSRPPIFEDCPETIYVNAGAHDCLEDIYLNDYFPEITDACGSVKNTSVTVTPGTLYESPAGSGEYYLRNITTGLHSVKIKAKDQCSNFAECEFDIQVVDESAPNVICDLDIVVSLNSLGMGKLYPESIDEGSFDACTDVHRQLYRMDEDCVNGDDLVPGDYITLCCNDVANSPIMVVMRVWDDADYDGIFGSAGDHFSECMVPISVFDKTIPEFQCPYDVTLTCNEDYTNLNITGSPAIETVCNPVEAEYVDDINSLSDCNLGVITRTWTITDTDVTCVQKITLQSPDVISEGDIVWPLDLEVSDECEVTNLGPGDLPPASGYPQFTDGQCSTLGMNHNDVVFETQDGNNTCYKIRRTWQVLNWCVATDDGFEVYEHVQTIKVTNSVPPMIESNCEDITIETTSEDCSGGLVSLSQAAIDDCTAPLDLTWTYAVDYGIDGSEDETGTSSSLDLEMPVGIHQITWEVSDGCNNSDVCTYLITVVDNTPPSPKCQSGVIVTLVANVGENTETAELWAVDLNAGSDHPCGSSYTFGFSFSDDPTDDVIYFDCADIGAQSVQLWLTDGNGNQAFCETTVIVQDNNGIEICDPSESMMANVAGKIATIVDVPVDSVEVTLDNGNQLELTDDTGVFAFDEMPMGGSYEVVPFLNTNHREGVSTLDIILIQRHILNLQSIESPYYLIAADANNSKSVTSADMVAIRNLILEVTDRFEDKTSWTFVDEEHQFIDPSYPWAPVAEETYQIPFLSHDMLTDFIAIKTGDVNGSYTQMVNGETGVDTRGDEDQIMNSTISDDGNITLSMESQSPIYGFQVSFKVDEGFKEVTSNLKDWSQENYHYADGYLNISYHNIDGIPTAALSTLFEIVTIGSSPLTLNRERDNASYHGDNLEVRQLRLEQSMNTLFEELAMSNHPNPWKDKTVISITSPEVIDGVLTFYNTLGSVILKKEVSLAQGKNEIVIDQVSLNVSGVVTYTLEIGEEELQSKMLIIE